MRHFFSIEVSCATETPGSKCCHAKHVPLKSLHAPSPALRPLPPPRKQSRRPSHCSAFPHNPMFGIAYSGTFLIQPCSRYPERLKRTALTSGCAALNALRLFARRFLIVPLLLDALHLLGSDARSAPHQHRRSLCCQLSKNRIHAAITLIPYNPNSSLWLPVRVATRTSPSSSIR